MRFLTSPPSLPSSGAGGEEKGRTRPLSIEESGFLSPGPSSGAGGEENNRTKICFLSPSPPVLLLEGRLGGEE